MKDNQENVSQICRYDQQRISSDGACASEDVASFLLFFTE